MNKNIRLWLLLFPGYYCDARLLKIIERDIEYKADRTVRKKLSQGIDSLTRPSRKDSQKKEETGQQGTIQTVSEMEKKDGEKFMGLVFGKPGVLDIKAVQKQQEIIEQQQY
jgi:hypothetical protein